MKEPNDKKHIEEILRKLEHSLAAERRALTSLDGDALDAFADAKEGLGRQLSDAALSMTPKHRSELERLRGLLRENLILLVHARDHASGLVALLSGQDPERAAPVASRGEGVRLDLRG